MGFSLIEVLVFITILSLFFVTAAAITIAVIRNMKFNEHKILATRYAEEGMSWLRNQKDINWQTFLSNSSAPVYCLSSPLADSLATANHTPCTVAGDLISGIYKREAALTNDGLTVTANLSVSWIEPGNQTKSVQLKNIFKVWE